MPLVVTRGSEWFSHARLGSARLYRKGLSLRSRISFVHGRLFIGLSFGSSINGIQMQTWQDQDEFFSFLFSISLIFLNYYCWDDGIL